MTGVEAFVFDLYGTLLRGAGNSIHRAIPRLLRVPPIQWLELVRGELLTSDFETDEAFARHVCDALVPGHDEALVGECLGLLRAEIASVRAYDGIQSLLAFLKRRGYRLGLLSNLSSVYKDPVSRSGIRDAFDAIVFSCESGLVKPDPAIYRDICSRLGVEPGSVLCVGDSFLNDVAGPREFGMQAIQVVAEPGAGQPDTSVKAGLLHVGPDGLLSPLLSLASVLETDKGPAAIRKIVPVSDDEQGRYNLVYRLETDDGPVFCKRYLLPESAWLECFAYRLQAEAGLPSCESHVLTGLEPLLITRPAAGTKYDGSFDEDTARELGRHVVFAYVFSNADIRPRNAFVDHSGGGVRMTMIDLEHCLFNVAINTTGLEHPERPETFDRMPADELSARTKKTVLSARSMRRARSTFFDDKAVTASVYDAFCSGFLDHFRHLQNDMERICGIVSSRIESEPHLIVGTQAYRRAMARVDLDDIRGRLEQSPEQGLAMLF